MSAPDTEAHRPPALGEPEEQCAHCGAVLAPDQRYCVNCGLRRAAPRVAYRDLLPGTAGAAAVAATTEPPAAAAPASPPPAAETRTVSPLGAAVAIGLLLLATLLGAVLGRGSDTNERPVIVGAPAASGQTTAGAPSSTDGGTPAVDAAAAGAAGAAAGAAGASKSGSSSSSGGSGSGSGSSAQPKSTAPSPSTQDFVKKSKKLPDKVGTGGKPPPKDDAAPGGGSEGTTIG